jgi:hypothetical protein
MGQRFDMRDFSIWRGALYDPASRTIFIRDVAFR